MNINDITDSQLTLIFILAVWDMIWKGFALWRAARNYHQNWFIALLVINSVGILPIFYLLTKKPENTETEN